MPSLSDYSVGDEVEVNIASPSRPAARWVRGVVSSETSRTLFIRIQQRSYYITNDTLDYIRMVKPKVKAIRAMSFTKWMNKLEGKEKPNVVSKTQEVRSGFGEGIDLLHQFLQRHVRLRDYSSRIGSLDIEERQASIRERKRLGVLLHDIDTMGLYNGDRSAYQQSVEYLTSNQGGEQQDVLPRESTASFSYVNTEDLLRGRDYEYHQW